jgi:hypothetical protein
MKAPSSGSGNSSLANRALNAAASKVAEKTGRPYVVNNFDPAVPDYHKKVTDDLSKEVNQINRKVDVLGNNQEHFKRQIESVDDRLEKIQDLLENGR